MSEKFALKWKDYQSNWCKSLSELRRETDFADVTLISDDKVKFAAHKILLTSCSNTFKVILKENSHSNPLLYLGGISSVNLAFILDYIYHGEVKLFQEQLDSFLDCVRKLEIESLIRQETMNKETHHENTFEHQELEEKKHEANERMDTSKRRFLKIQKFIESNNKPAVKPRKINSTISNEKIDVTSLSPEVIDEQMKKLYQKINGGWSCLSCDYISLNKTSSGNIRRHVEIHLEGLSYPCNLCNQEFRLKESLRNHKFRTH